MARTRNDYGFFPAAGTDYAYGQEPELARRLTKLANALKLHLIGISGHRTPQHSVEVGGFANDPHTRGQASDTPGIEGVSESTLRSYGLTRPFPGASEADHIQLFGGARGSKRDMTKGGRHHLFSIAELWIQAGGPRNLAPTMAAIAMAESGGRVDNVGGPNTDGTYDYGLFQINSSHSQFDANRLVSDAAYNAKAAVSIWRSQGLGAWSTYNSGAYKSFIGGGKSYAPSFGRTRPGGDTGQPDPGAGVDAAFASYMQEGANTENVAWVIPGTPLILPWNPLDVFKGAKDAVNSASDFMKWVAWIFHPRNILRAVEFLTGLTFVLLGIHTAMQVHKGDEETSIKRAGQAAKKGAKEAVAATPVGRGVRVAKGARAGRQATRNATRRKEFEGAYKRGKKGETRKQGEKAMDKKYGGVPF